MRIVSVNLKKSDELPVVQLKHEVGVIFEGECKRIKGELSEILKLIPSKYQFLDICFGKNLILDLNETNTSGEDVCYLVQNSEDESRISLFISETLRILQSPMLNYPSSIATFDVYLICYNEIKILPKVFQHYRQARRIVVYDNESTDGSRELIESLGGVLETFQTNGEFNDVSNIQIKNHAWKNSRGLVDFVIVQDADEFLHFPEYPNELSIPLTILRDANVYYTDTTGYEMFPKIIGDEPITNQRFGYPNQAYNKPMLFNPNIVIETNYIYGAHYWTVEVKQITNPSPLSVCLLHYKHLGFDWEYERRKLLRARPSGINKKLDLGVEYNLPDPELYKYVSEFYDDSKIKDLSDILDTRPKITGNTLYNVNLGITGGLGNQLFLIASTLAVAFEKNYHPCFKYSAGVKRYDKSIFRNLEFTSQTNCSTELYGYFQSAKYFKPYWNRIQPLLDFTADVETLNILRKNSGKIIALHVRRTDYAPLGWILPTSYYIEAMKLFPNCKFAIFSDDLDWVRKTFIGDEFLIVDQPDESKVLWLYSKLDGYIIANSTFSWWGAFLGTRKLSKKVIAPYPWFKTKHVFNPDIYEPEWVKLNV
jgi:hypothetical protein